MANLNRVTIIGNLGADPELRYTQDNTPVATLRVATNEFWTDKASGESQKSTEWHRVSVWGRQAENCDKYLSAGSTVYVEGSLRTRKWEDKEGGDRWTTEIKARNVQFLSGKGGNTNTQAATPDAPAAGFGDDDLPE